MNPTAEERANARLKDVVAATLYRAVENHPHIEVSGMVTKHWEMELAGPVVEAIQSAERPLRERVEELEKALGNLVDANHHANININQGESYDDNRIVGCLEYTRARKALHPEGEGGRDEKESKI